MRIVKRRLCRPIAYCDHNISDLFTFRQIGREKRARARERERERERESILTHLSLSFLLQISLSTRNVSSYTGLNFINELLNLMFSPEFDTW